MFWGLKNSQTSVVVNLHGHSNDVKSKKRFYDMSDNDNNEKNDHDSLIKFKAEVKLDIKYMRENSKELKKTISSIDKKLKDICIELAVLKTKVAMYSIIGAFIVSTIVSVVVAFIK